MEKLILTAAITGAATVPSQTPYLPLTPRQIADSAIEAAEAGAAIVHIHARRPEDGLPSSDPEHFREIVTRIKEHSDVVICLTTGGSILMTVEERARVVPLFSPEMCSFNLGSINFALHTSIERIKEFKYDWEKPYLEKSKDFVFKNTFQDFEYLCKIIRENGKAEGPRQGPPGGLGGPPVLRDLGHPDPDASVVQADVVSPGPRRDADFEDAAGMPAHGCSVRPQVRRRHPRRSQVWPTVTRSYCLCG